MPALGRTATKTHQPAKLIRFFQVRYQSLLQGAQGQSRLSSETALCLLRLIITITAVVLEKYLFILHKETNIP